MVDLIRNSSNIDESLASVSSQGKQLYIYIYIIALFLIVHLGIYATIDQLMTFQISLISISN